MAQQVGSLGTVPAVNIGGYQYPIPSGVTMIALQGYVTANTYSAMRTGTLSTSYQVTAGKTFYVVAAIFMSVTGAPQMAIGSGTTDIGLNSAAAPTSFAGTVSEITVAGVGSKVEVPYMQTVTFAAARYPTLKCTGSGVAIVYGYEA